jgi:hypothetical protein
VQDLLAPVPRQPRPLCGVRLLEERMNTAVGMHIPTDAQSLGELLAASGYFTDARGAAQAAVKVMAGQELGFGPIASMTGIYIVKGRVTLSANLMAAAIKRQRPRYDYRVREHTAEFCSIEFLQDGEHLGESTYSMQDAQAAGLASSETWKKHPRNMLFARALSNGAKWYCPDATPAQLSFLKKQVEKAKREGMNSTHLRLLLDNVGAQSVEISEGWMERLSKAQASGLLGKFEEGILPTGESDIPADAGEFVPPADANPDEFFEAAKS